MRVSIRPVVQTSQGVLVTIHAIPNAKETSIALESDGGVTMRIRAPPVKGKANREVVRWLSKKFDKASSQVRIVSGFHSSLKVVEISGVDEKTFLAVLSSGFSRP